MGTITKKSSYELNTYNYANNVLTSDFSAKRNILTDDVVSIDGQLYKADEEKTYIGNFNVSKNGEDYTIATTQVPFSMIDSVNSVIHEIVTEITAKNS